jgi:hypothetical protein
LYRELRSLLAPVMKRHGFKRLKSGYLGWVRTTAQGELTFWFQSNKWGWNDAWGSTFTVDFEFVPSPIDSSSARKPRQQRIGYLLEGFEELDELRRMNNLVIQKLPGTMRREWVTRRLPDGTDLLVDGYKTDPEKAVYGRDVWLNYHSTEDVRAWAAYFGEKLPRFISLFENEVRSEVGQTVDRFHHVLGEVQRAPTVTAKAAILRQYISAEQDQHCQSAAKHYLKRVEEAARKRPEKDNV